MMKIHGNILRLLEASVKPMPFLMILIVGIYG